MLKPWWVFLIFSTLIYHRNTEAREVTNEDIRDAILSLVHMVRAGEDKLERHEYRERQLGEQFKKALAGLDKRHRNLEPVKGILSRLDERLASVETILLQQDERERIQLAKTTEALTALRKTVEAHILAPKPDEEPPASNQELLSLASKQKEIGDKVDAVLNKVQDIENKVSAVQVESKDIKKASETAANKVNEMEGKLNLGEQLLAKYEYSLSELNERKPVIVQQDDGNSKEELKDLLTALDSQKKDLQTLSSDLTAMSAKFPLPSYPPPDEVEAQNKTLEYLQELKYEINAKAEKTAVKVAAKIEDLEQKIGQNQNELIHDLSEFGKLNENVVSSVSKSYETLRGEVQALGKMEKVLVQSADNVMDTKRRIEYGVHQILLEVGDLVKIQSKEINTTLNNRFDNIEVTILDNQTGALANLSSKLEQEMTQVWRQIGIMYQELTASTTALDRLQEQTETYVNGSFKIMDSMGSKVTQMNTRMVEVDENMNYLLGRLSLVSQEFNEIRNGLGDALEAVKNSFKTVQDKLKDAGPGPHQIEPDRNEKNEK